MTVFDAHSGKVLAEWGGNTFAMPHGLTVDRDDNVWLTDVALQQVYKFTHDGQFLIAHDIDVAQDGAVYVGDITGGRVQKFVSGK